MTPSHGRTCRALVGAMFFAAISLGAPTLVSAQGVMIYVNPDGRDSNDGATPPTALASPALAIERAAALDRQRVPDVSNDGGIPPPVVQIAAGKFRLRETIELTAAHSGRPGRPVVVHGSDSGETVITAAWSAGPPYSVSDPAVRARLSPGAASWVRAYDLAKAGIPPPPPVTRYKSSATANVAHLQVLFRGNLYDPARWPDRGYARLRATETGRDARMFSVGRPITDWTGERDLLACGFFGPQFYDECMPFEIVDVREGIGRLSERTAYGLRTDRRFVVYHALAELDTPGEWWFDGANQRLYFWPPSAPTADDVEVSVLENVLRARGVRHLRLENLAIEGARGDGLVFEDVDTIAVERVIVRNVGSRGIAVNGRNVTIRHCAVHAVGEGAIMLLGGDFRNLTPSGHVVEDCKLRDFNRRLHSFRVGIFMNGVGHKVIGNEISDSGGYGILSYAAEVEIAGNRLGHLSYNLGDGSAIYVAGRDWTKRGNIIHNNIIYDIDTTTDEANRGIYLDDMASGNHVFENALLRVNLPIFIGGGRDNIIERNILVASNPTLYVDERGNKSMRSFWEPIDGEMRRLVEAAIRENWPHLRRYPTLAHTLGDHPGSPVNTVFRDNIVIGKPDIQLHGLSEFVRISGTLDDNDVVPVRGLNTLMATQRPDLSDFLVKVRPHKQGRVSPPAIWMPPAR